MNTDFQITAIDPATVNYLFEMNDAELAGMDAVRRIVDEKPGFPCRVSLQDAEIGEEVILFPYKCHNVNTPYRAESPVYVRKNAVKATPGVNEIPGMLRHRTLSLRAFSEKGMLLDAATIKGNKASGIIKAMFLNNRVAYIHVHNAGPGCFNCRVNRIANALSFMF